MILKIRSFFKKERGDVVQFVIVLPLMLLLVALLLISGQMLYNKGILADATFEAARIASTKTSVVDADQAVHDILEQRLPSGIGINNFNYEVKVEGTGNWERGELLTVSVTAEAKPLVVAFGKDKFTHKNIKVRMIENS